MASATKMMTALVTVERVTLEEEVRVSPSAAAVPGGKLSLISGETFSVKELLAALLLNSSNDAAVALAEHVSGSETAFVGIMNRMASRLGAQHTSYVNAHGLDAEGHETSAKDLALVGRELLEDDVLAELVAERALTITSDKRSARLDNTNLLLGDYVGAVGIKTGFTALAGNVLVAAATRDERTLIAVAMDSDDSFADARLLLDRGFAELARTVLVSRDLLVAEVIAGDGGSVSVVTGSRYRGAQMKELVSTRFVLSDDLALPITEGDVVGEVRVHEAGVEIASVPGVAATEASLERPGFVERGLLGLLSLAGRLQTAMGDA